MILSLRFFLNKDIPPRYAEVLLQNIMMKKKIQGLGRASGQQVKGVQVTQLEKLGYQQSTLGLSREAARWKEGRANIS